MRRIFQLFTFALAAALLVVPAARSASSDMVVSQVFAGGGNTGAPYTNDYVELFNRGATSVDLSSWSVQYATGSGTTWQVTPLSGSVQPGGRYLVQLASAAVGAALPTPDATGTTNLAVSGGKVALVHAAAALACGASCSADPLVSDLVGYGSATDYEGTAAAPAISNRLRPCAPAAAAPTPTRTRATSPQRRRARETRRHRRRRAPLRHPPGRWSVAGGARRRRYRLGSLDRPRAAEHQLRQRGCR